MRGSSKPRGGSHGGGGSFPGRCVIGRDSRAVCCETLSPELDDLAEKLQPTQKISYAASPWALSLRWAVCQSRRRGRARPSLPHSPAWERPVSLAETLQLLECSRPSFIWNLCGNLSESEALSSRSRLRQGCLYFFRGWRVSSRSFWSPRM